MAGSGLLHSGPPRARHEVPRTLRRIRIVTYAALACVGAVYLGMQIATLTGIMASEPAPAAPAVRSAIIPSAALR